jgi:hypothetical protein
LEKPKEFYHFREADILAYGGAKSTEKKNEKWKTRFKGGNGSGVQSFSHHVSVVRPFGSGRKKITQRAPWAQREA